jgi:hypothetical protein
MKPFHFAPSFWKGFLATAIPRMLKSIPRRNYDKHIFSQFISPGEAAERG